MKNLMETPEYKSGNYHIVICPICGAETLNNYWICETCGWEYDGSTKTGQYSSANKCLVEDYKKKLSKK